MQGSPYYHELTGKYIAAFGSLFTDIRIQRFDADKRAMQTIKVPVTYGPREKFEEINRTDPDKNRPYKRILPLIAYSLVNLEYDPERQRKHQQVINNYGGSNADGYQRVLEPVPYNITFDLVVYGATGEDAHKIMEQIIPNFRPEFNLTVIPLDDMDNIRIDTPVFLTGMEHEDTYDQGDIKDTRIVSWRFTFLMKVYFWGPTNRGKVIKIATVNLYASDRAANTSPDVIITTRPGLTIDGNPTTNINETIPYQQIEADDNYGYIVTVQEPKL